ncbi:MAG TPA: cell division protein FtsA [Clostridiaceae bacterium]|jgi:cell division protein FtsA|nr:cell division protein FtsA [Clostridiaceae bacterium]
MQVKKEVSSPMPDDVIFALDIGTRTIIGVVGVQKEERFFVQAAEMIVHESRAMLDGQIHDIAKVAQGAAKVKDALEKKIGHNLTRVSIAAAGRVLKTCQIKVERDIEDGKEIDQQLISALEMEGVQKAQSEIENSLSSSEKDQYYCVGYSVVTYYLNNYVISNLVGHKGHRAGVEVLATFLPQTVVDSLYTVMERINLEVNFITLEPIAALNLAIPKDLRLLNLALVDIGAGTSDIAITKSGTITAYAMVPIAGDEVSEAIAQSYLVDFETAEKIKTTLSGEEKDIVFTDILDNEVTAKADEIIRVTNPVVENLAKTIAERILELNGGKAPNAVFLVGGGSQSSGLCEAISDSIGLPRERVAIRNRSIAKNIDTDVSMLDGPDSITPLGILVTTALTKGQDFYYVFVNDKKIRMYNARKMLVSDALILAGFNPDQLICRSGKSLKFKFNNKDRTIRGSMGKPAEIYLNGKVSSLNKPIEPGDKITVVPAKNGKDAAISAGDLAEKSEPVYVKFNDQTYTIKPKVLINGIESSLDTPVQQGDRVDIINDYSLDDVARLLEFNPLVSEFMLNGSSAGMETVLKPGDEILVVPRKYQNTVNTDEESHNSDEKERFQNIEDNPEYEWEKDVIKGKEQKFAEKKGIIVFVNEKSINLPPKNTDYLFIDLFNFIDFDLTMPKGILMLKLNENDANYTDKIRSGDRIKIYWQE